MPNLPWGFTNSTIAAGDAVLKTYDGPDAELRREAEAGFFSALQGILPVPRVLSTKDSLVLRTERLPGQVATDVIETGGNASWVFPAAGALLRRLSAAGIPAGTLPGAGPVLVHGDYGPQNLLVDPERRVITALLDAESSKHAAGDLQHADAAWFEWIIRYHHPGLIPHLPAFHEGYGAVPPWSLRQQLMLLRCQEVLDFAIRRDGADGGGAALWRERLAATRAFTG